MAAENKPHLPKQPIIPSAGVSADTVLAQVVGGYSLAVSVHERNGICVVWNKKAEQLFGVTAQTVQGKPLATFLPKSLVPALAELDKQTFTQPGVSPQTTMTCQTADGKPHVLAIQKTLLPGTAATGVLVLTTYEDITSRYVADQELQRRSTLLQAILDNVPLGLYTRDCDAKMTFFNKQSMKVLNEKDSKFSDHPHSFQGEDTIRFQHARERQILQEGKPYEYPEEHYIDSSGKEKILHIIKVPLMDAGPKPLVLSIVEDITKRRQQEKEIERVNNFLAAIVQNAPIGLYVRGEDGQMLLRNKQCNAIFGNVDEADFDEKGNLPHETGEQVSHYINREQEILKTGKIVDIAEEAYTTAGGEKRLLHLVKVPVVGKTERFVVTLVEDITQRRQQENSLIETKTALQTILEHIPVAVYARSVDDKVSFINRRAYEMFPGETEYKRQDDFYGKREQAIFENGKMLEFPEEWYTTKTGEKILLHLIKVPVFGKDGEPAMVLTVAEDITAKKAQEKAIVDAKNFLQAVINQLPVSLCVKNYAGEYILWNKKSEELFGARAEDVIGRTTYHTNLNKDQAEFLREADLRVFESRKEQNIPQELISSAKDGIKIMHTVKTPVFNPDGTPNCLLVVSEDITAQTKMEKQIREASDKNTLLVENAREGVVIVEDGRVFYANRAFCRLLGYSELDEIKGKPLVELACEDHRLFLKDKAEEVLLGTTDAATPLEVRFMRKNATAVETEFAAVASKYLGRRILLCFVRDVTQANRALRDVRAERENFRVAFAKNITPAFILTHKGYISVMNEAALTLLQFTEADRNFYRNIYIRPAISLAARKRMKVGEGAEMDYVLDFDKAAQKFPGRIHAKGQLPLHITFVPMNKRDAKDGTVEADYVVYMQPKTPAVKPPRPTLKRKPTMPLPPLVAGKLPHPTQEVLVLPNSEPYALCDADFAIVSCNDLFCSLCQLKTDELTGQDIRRIIQADSLAQFEQDLRTLRQEGKLDNREYTITIGSGLETCAVRLTAVKEADGRYLFVLRSMMFHLQIMKILQERSARLSALLAATDGVVFTVGFDHSQFGRIEQDNPYLEGKLGFSHEELLSLSFADLFCAPQGQDETFVSEVLSRAAFALRKDGKAAFRLPVRKKDGTVFEAQAHITQLDLPGQETVLVVLQDMTEQLTKIAQESRAEKELKSVRQTLPGLYLKADENGRIVQASSNLPYLTAPQAQALFLQKEPTEFWPREVADSALVAVKETLSMNVRTQFEFAWELDGQEHFFEAVITPIEGRREVVLWIKDTSPKRMYNQHIHELYRITREPGLTLTEQVNKMLDFGKKIFKGEIGLLLRFQQGKNRLESRVLYATDNDLHIERGMVFAVGECLANVADGNPVLHTELSGMECSHCIHTEKEFNSLVASPLCVGGKVVGALCFASSKIQREFCAGAEELLGLMARLVSLRIELRQTGKMLGEASRTFAKTLEYLEMPAVMLDTDYQITFANAAFLTQTGHTREQVAGNDFFATIVRNDDISKQTFKQAVRENTAASFQLRLDTLEANGLYQDAAWDVFICKDADGQIDGYALVMAPEH